jgi:hypothetical protein
MRVIRDDIWLCTECLIVAVNGDESPLVYSYGHGTPDFHKRSKAIETGLDRLGPRLVPDFDSESGEGCEEEIGAYVTRRPCDCCRTHLHGSRHRFAILGE